MEDFEWPDIDNLLQQLEYLSASTSKEQQDAMARELTNIFDGFEEPIDLGLPPLGDAGPEERTTVPSSFQSNITPETEKILKQERVNTADAGRQQTPASQPVANSSTTVELDVVDDGDLGSLPIPAGSPNHGGETLNMEDVHEDEERAGDDLNKRWGGAPATYTSNEGIDHLDRVAYSGHEGNVWWPMERFQHGLDLLLRKPNGHTELMQGITSPADSNIAVPNARAFNVHHRVQPEGSKRPLPFPFVRDPRLFLPGLANPVTTSDRSAKQALQMPEPFLTGVGLSWAPQTGYLTPAAGEPGPSGASTPSAEPVGDRCVGYALSADASRQSQAGPSRRGKQGHKRESKAQTRMCTLGTCEYFGHTFNCKKDLIRHVRFSRHHQGEEGSLPRPACPLCSKDCARPDSLDRHLRKVHGVSIASPSDAN